jgi:hypothetical protein
LSKLKVPIRENIVQALIDTRNDVGNTSIKWSRITKVQITGRKDTIKTTRRRGDSTTIKKLRRIDKGI